MEDVRLAKTWLRCCNKIADFWLARVCKPLGLDITERPVICLVLLLLERSLKGVVT